jgi:O-antigen/teichoic acid export membrane protein
MEDRGDWGSLPGGAAMMVTSTRLLARNTAVNLAGQVIPLGIAVVAVPVLIHALGEDRFGILTLAWALIGYFALLDFGLGRALTQAASEAVGRGDPEQLRELSIVSIAVMILLGVLGAIVVAALTPWLAHGGLKMGAALRPEAATSFYLLALSLPFVLGTIGFRALLEAHQHFGLATALRLPFSIFNFVGPLLVLPFSRSLVPIVGLLVIGRIFLFIAHFIAALRHYPWLRGATSLSGALPQLLPLLRVGGWMMVSNVVSPLMVYLDRFIIGALMSMAAVAYYVTAFELVSKLLIVPAAIVGVFFPAFAATYAHDRDRTAAMFDRATRMVLIMVFPMVLVMVAFSQEILSLWVGAYLASQSAVVLQILAIGVLINSFAQAPFALLQATRRPDLTARLHMVELPVYLVMIFVLGSRRGVAGVALAWTIRVALDTAVLSWMSRRELSELAPKLERAFMCLLILVAAACVVALPEGLFTRGLLTAVTLVTFATFGWVKLLSPAEREVVLEYLRWRPRRPASAS